MNAYYHKIISNNMVLIRQGIPSFTVCVGYADSSYSISSAFSIFY